MSSAWINSDIQHWSNNVDKSTKMAAIKDEQGQNATVLINSKSPPEDFAEADFWYKEITFDTKKRGAQTMRPLLIPR